LWFGPAILLLVGVLVVVNIIRKRARMNIEDDAMDAQS